MNPGLHRFAIFLVALALVVVVSGAYITSTAVAARSAQSDVSPVLNEGLHRALGIALAALTLSFAIWTGRAAAPTWIKAAAWTGVATLVLASGAGWRTAPLDPWTGVFHALLSHVFFALMVVMAIGTSTIWNRAPELALGPSRPLLRPAAVATPPIVLLQIALGAAYRHNIASVLPHMAVAMGVAFLALIVSSSVLQNFPQPASLRRAAAALIAIVLTQVCLGIAAFLLLLLNYAATSYFMLATVAHVLMGAATLAAGAAMAIEIRRSIPPRAA